MPIPLKWKERSLPIPEALLSAHVGVVYPDLTTDRIINCPAYYLHGVRNGVLARLGSNATAQREATYQRSLPAIAEAICDALESRGINGASVVVPPSSRADARPYADEILRRRIASADLSACVQRLDSSFRAGSAIDWPSVRSSVSVVGQSRSVTPSPLIVVDDVLSSGRSVAATVLALRDAGMCSMDDPVFVVAVLSIALPELGACTG